MQHGGRVVNGGVRVRAARGERFIWGWMGIVGSHQPVRNEGREGVAHYIIRNALGGGAIFRSLESLRGVDLLFRCSSTCI